MSRKKKKNKISRAIAKIIRELGPSAVVMYPVYAQGKVAGKPICYVTQAERDEYVRNGSAVPVSCGTAIKLLINLEEFRGQSCSMGPHVAESAADGVPFYASLVDGWQLILPGSYCPLVLQT